MKMKKTKVQKKTKFELKKSIGRVSKRKWTEAEKEEQKSDRRLQNARTRTRHNQTTRCRRLTQDKVN
ncbi:hypothetical protein HYE27_04160 [Mycoplasmopsis bovis]|nr:hypothetical protein HYE27_04160 [Mycoplasmopsis bovis]